MLLEPRSARRAISPRRNAFDAGDADVDALAVGKGDDAGTSGEVVWYENQAGSHFPEGASIHVATVTPYAMCLAAADLDGDADVDVVSGSKSTWTLQWYENDGDASFVAHDIGTTTIDTQALAIGHIDGGANPDIVVAGDGAGLHWAKTDETLNLIASPAGESNYAYAVRAADFDGDGEVDAAVAAYHDNAITAYLQQTGGEWTSLTVHSSANPPRAPAPKSRRGRLGRERRPRAYAAPESGREAKPVFAACWRRPRSHAVPEACGVGMLASPSFPRRTREARRLAGTASTSRTSTATESRTWSRRSPA